MSKLRRSARGQQCTVNAAGVCNYDSTTVVGGHVRGAGGGEGMGKKPTDSAMIWVCSDCHDLLDGRRQTTDDWESNKWWYIARALIRTHTRMMEAA